MRYFVLTPDGKNREITPEQYERLEMDNRNGWGERTQQAVSKDFLGTVHNNQEVRGVKHDFSKPQMSLLPLKDLEGVVRVLEFGAKKYARGDWAYVEEGGPRYLDAGIRHLEEVLGTGGLDNLKSLDPESGLPHIDHAICSLIFARHFIFKGDDNGE